VIAAGTVVTPVHGPFAVVLSLSAVVWLVLELRQGITRRPEAAKSDRGSLMVLRAAYLGGGLVAIIAARALPAAAIQPESLAGWLSLIFLWSGIALRLWSFRTLGRYFTFTVQTSSDQPVITKGPYRFVRHPGYAGLLLAVIGLSFLFGNWVSAIGMPLAGAAGLVYRIRVEERALTQALGDTYRDYAAARRRLVPFVW
jgi:protein-S-isoprenylcysteine O-methyltransferase Ste14